MSKAVLVVGDVMLDRMVDGVAARISPEAPTMVIRQQRIAASPGGAANVAANVVSLGGSAFLAGAVGEDPAAQELDQLLGQIGVATALVRGIANQPTTTKLRVFAQARQVIRIDCEAGSGRDGLYNTPILLTRLQSLFSGVGSIGCILVVDYNKGVVTAELMQFLRDAARTLHIPILLDAKPTGCDLDASLVKMNLHEGLIYAAATGCIHPGLSVPDRHAQAEIVIKHIRSKGAAIPVITAGELGAAFWDDLANAVTWVAPPPGTQTEVDPTGAGDTFSAALAVASVAGLTLHQAVQRAVFAASLAVRRPGVVCVSADAVDDAIAASQGWAGKIMTEAGVAALLARSQRQGKRVVLTNGCFDALHAGHIQLLRAAAKEGDVLIVAYNDDASLQALKGAGRPIVPDSFRAAHLAQLDCVSAVFRFDGDAEQLVRRLRPDVLVKGRDALLAGLVPGADFMASRHGRVVFVPVEFNIHSSLLSPAR